MNQDIQGHASSIACIDSDDRSIKNLSMFLNSFKSKQTELTWPKELIWAKPKISDLAKTKKLNFIKTNPSKMYFLPSKAKEAFIHLLKDFTKVLILRHFNLKQHIYIETNTLGYTITRVLNQMTFD